MNVAVKEVRFSKFNFDTNIKNDVSEENHNGQLSIAFPENVNDEDTEITVKAKINIKIIEENFFLEAEIKGSFKIPNDDYSDKESEITKKLINSILKPMLDKAKWFYGLFFNDVNDFLILPEIEFIEK